MKVLQIVAWARMVQLVFLIGFWNKTPQHDIIIPTILTIYTRDIESKSPRSLSFGAESDSRIWRRLRLLLSECTLSLVLCSFSQWTVLASHATLSVSCYDATLLQIYNFSQDILNHTISTSHIKSWNRSRVFSILSPKFSNPAVGVLQQIKTPHPCGKR